ncbi:MAG: metallophosphoesterase [Promethearchaeota archaeon]
MFNLDLKKGEFPIIIKPNLGQPILINLKEYRDENGNYIKNVTFDAILIALPNQSIEEILRFFHLNIFIQPILKDSGEFFERRGDRYPLEISEIKKIKLDNEYNTLLNEEDCIYYDLTKGLFEIEDIYGKRKTLYKITFLIKFIKLIDNLIKKLNQNLLLFDIIHQIPNHLEEKVNYHSIAFYYDKNWKNFRFIHATDFHVARRNDFLMKYIKDKAREKIRLNRRKRKNLSRNDMFTLTRDFEYREEFQDHRLEDLRYAKYNFNYNLRLLIEFINNEVRKNRLDFVLMSGDLIDYLTIARGNYQYKNNLHVFIDILLGINRGLDKPPYLIEKEYINKYEILAPVFTIVGNHDYRKGHYSLRIGTVHKIFGLKHKDIIGYHDIKFFNYFKALYSKNKFLRDYLKYINPNLNFRLKIGNDFNLIFIDTGQDSIADMHDLMKGGPSTKGLKDYQLDILRAYIKLAGDEKIIIVMHTPPISPNLSRLKKWKFKRKFKLKRKLRWEDFYEYNLKNYIGNARLEKILNLKYQTIMYNWSNLLKIFTGSDKKIRRKVDLILCGHTHTLKEFRLKEVKKEEADKINLGFYIAPIFINVPCEVYTNNYRVIFQSFRDPMNLKIWFDVHKPFIFQTQAIGPISLNYKYKPPGFRYITVEQNQVRYVKVYSLHLKESNL